MIVGASTAGIGFDLSLHPSPKPETLPMLPFRNKRSPGDHSFGWASSPIAADELALVNNLFCKCHPATFTRLVHDA